MARWPDGPMARWPDGPMARWPDGQMALSAAYMRYVYVHMPICNFLLCYYDFLWFYLQQLFAVFNSLATAQIRIQWQRLYNNNDDMKRICDNHHMFALKD